MGNFSQLPCAVSFNNLHVTESLKAAREALRDLSGIYCIANEVTGAIYIGSSVDLRERFSDHIIDQDTNRHLQNAINHYGLDNFVFSVIEFVDNDQLITREQFKKGHEVPLEVRAKISANNGRAVGVTVYDLEGNIVAQFPSHTAAAEWLGVIDRLLLKLFV
ncbi:hypothetical protein BC938DRAFT_480875 [Jimgerdemannia flammicorona]|nr:hypothetical protein BC938DRAFT_480875 [Jimgerdemannia flammicorona]